MSEVRTGPDCKVYVNEGTYEAPELTEIDLVADASIDGSYTEGDSSARRAHVQTAEPLMLNLSTDLRVRKDITDAGYNLLRDAFLQKTTIDVFILDGAEDEDNTTGYRFDAKVFSFGEDQALGNVLFNTVNIKPCASDHNPQAVKVVDGTMEFQEIGEEVEEGS